MFWHRLSSGWILQMPDFLFALRGWRHDALGRRWIGSTSCHQVDSRSQRGLNPIAMKSTRRRSKNVPGREVVFPLIADAEEDDRGDENENGWRIRLPAPLSRPTESIATPLSSCTNPVHGPVPVAKRKDRQPPTRSPNSIERTALATISFSTDGTPGRYWRIPAPASQRCVVPARPTRLQRSHAAYARQSG